MHLNSKPHWKLKKFKSLQASFFCIVFFFKPKHFHISATSLPVCSTEQDYILCGQSIRSGLGKGQIPGRSEPMPYSISLQLQSGQSNRCRIGGASQFHQSLVTTYSGNQTGAALTLFRMSRTQDPSVTWSGLIGLCVAEEKMDEELLIVAPAIFVASRQAWIHSPCLAERNIFFFSWLVKYILELPWRLKWKTNLLEAKPKEQLQLSFWMFSVTVTVMWEDTEFTFNNFCLHECDVLVFIVHHIVPLMFFHTAVYLQTWVDVDIDIDETRGMRTELD